MLDVVIVTARGAREHLRACLASLELHRPDAAPMTVHVVDNASGDGTARMVQSEFPDVELIELDRNAGFAAANNVVLRRSVAPFALLLNPDTELTAGALDHMISVVKQRPDVGLAGCRLLKPDGTLDHAAKWVFPTPLTALAHFTGIGRRSRVGGYRARHVPERGAGEVDSVSGAFMLVRREAIEDVGLLDEAYWLYIEDLDWCYRFKQRGWKVWYDGAATVLHVKGVVSRHAGPHRSLRAEVAFHRGMGRFYRKFYAGRRPARDVLVYTGIGAKLATSATRGALARRRLG